MPTILQIGEASLCQLNQTGEMIAQYYYKDMVEIVQVCLLCIDRCLIAHFT